MNYLIDSASFLKEEIEKDIKFFGSCGFLVGMMCLCNFDTTHIFETKTIHQLALKVFEDFLSPHAFGFIFLLYSVFSSIVNFSSKVFNRDLVLAKNIASHAEYRLNQIGSSIISFMVGFAAAMLILSLKEKELSLLFSISLLFAMLIAESIMMAKLLSRRDRPIDRYFFLLVTAAFFTYMLFWQVVPTR